ncbi:MAG TPA: hypothetical protein H9891_03285 [Candidatus Salinicoccus stercoripullorum]|uniref:Uncharacterized protein n=1 Tax=Candidatus Salinicoccus stercoripullorum TaxID=2838756 RepID=A0A9D1QH94_9STAP|nr:hypothetical protein [Candidatus Salinicoccus stercoripullorum]
MDALKKELENDLGDGAWILDIHNNPFFDFFSEKGNVRHGSHVNDAVLLFNTALNFLDETPEDENRELHVLAGDYLFSRFYMYLAKDGSYSVLRDMMKISKQLSSRKSRLASSGEVPGADEVKWLLYAPMLYLVEHGFADGGLEVLIDEQMKTTDITSLPYITQE